MNDKIMTMGIFVFFIMIGINGFLLMAANLYDQDGNTLDLFYGLTSSGLSGNIEDKTIAVSTELNSSSTTPSTSQGFTPITIDDNPSGLNVLSQMAIMVAGVQLIMLKFSELFPIIAPITTAIVFFITAIQLLVAGYVGSILVRAIFGRVL
jgi:hypothetical protein